MDKLEHDDILKPELRYNLKAKIINKGFWTLKKFSGATGINSPILSRVVSGWEIPTAEQQKSIAGALGITLRELGELLNPDKEAV